jgi:4-hydroxy-tetrahydrodipicolinate synthase
MHKQERSDSFQDKTAGAIPGPAAGVWPVMLTAFTRNRQIDWDGIDRLTDWYLASGVAGLFAVCGSSEMRELTAEERLALAKRVVKRANGHVQVLATGTFGGTIEEQAVFVQKMADAGVVSVVCLVNELAGQNQTDELWKAHVEELLEKTGGIPLGLYECPMPYHRLLSPQLLNWLVSTKRFIWLKETSEQLDLIEKKIEAIRDTSLHFYNANTVTLLSSLRLGAHGFSGIAANFCPALFVWLCGHFKEHPQIAERLQRFLSIAGALKGYKYPASAKQFLSLSGMNINTTCRVLDHAFSVNEIGMLEALRREIQAWQKELELPDVPF